MSGPPQPPPWGPPSPPPPPAPRRTGTVLMSLGVGLLALTLVAALVLLRPWESPASTSPGISPSRPDEPVPTAGPADPTTVPAAAEQTPVAQEPAPAALELASPDAAPIEASRNVTVEMASAPSERWRWGRDEIDPDRVLEDHRFNSWGEGHFIGFAASDGGMSVVQARTWDTGELIWMAQFEGGLLNRCQEMAGLEVVCHSDTEIWRIDRAGRAMEVIEPDGVIQAAVPVGTDVVFLTRPVGAPAITQQMDVAFTITRHNWAEAVWTTSDVLEANSYLSLNLDYGDWVTVEADSERTVAWARLNKASFDLGTGERLSFPPANFHTDGNLILTPGSEGEIVVRDRAGTELYRFAGEPASFQCAAGITDALPTYQDNGEAWDFVARARSGGSALWTLPGAVPQCQVDGTYVMAESTSTLAAYDAGTGTLRWRTEVPGGDYRNFRFGTDGQRLLGFSGELGFAVDIASGEEVWQTPLGGTPLSMSDEEFYAVDYTVAGVLISVEGGVAHLS